VNQTNNNPLIYHSKTWQFMLLSVFAIGVLLIFLLNLSAMAQTTATSGVHSQFHHFITRDGTRLMDGAKEFRFLGLDAPALLQNEDQVKPDFSNRFPDEYEIRDTLTTIRQMGGRATRCYTFSIHKSGDSIPVYINGIRQYNEDAFRTFDRVLLLANQIGIRIIVPIIDVHDFYGWGGIQEFAAFRHKSAEQFWIDPELRQDFKNLLWDVLNRTNTLTGVQYKNDPAILAWQLGNELDCFPWNNPDKRPIMAAWSLEMASYIHSIDTNHLVMEGRAGRWEEVAANPSIDILSKHYYVYFSGEKNLYKWCRGDKQRANGYGKVFIVDEFGLGATTNLLDLMNEIITSGTSGGLLWSLRSHRQDGGFYSHDEAGGYKSYHWPGFPSGDFQDETHLLGLLRARAFAIRHAVEEPLPRPSAPFLLPIRKHAISWQGSVGASSYILQRCETGSDNWTTIATHITDDREPPLYLDQHTPTGKKLSYRVIACNSIGQSPPSNVVNADDTTLHSSP
jgi:hypothetical protein